MPLPTMERAGITGAPCGKPTRCSGHGSPPQGLAGGSGAPVLSRLLHYSWLLEPLQTGVHSRKGDSGYIMLFSKPRVAAH